MIHIPFLESLFFKIATVGHMSNEKSYLVVSRAYIYISIYIYRDFVTTPVI